MLVWSPRGGAYKAIGAPVSIGVPPLSRVDVPKVTRRSRHSPMPGVKADEVPSSSPDDISSQV